ncbi:hypothetical protein NPIL_439681 [Nephila pilipes]|uniref:Uncharacterized protein n=1 Tax=Nephila pilipes TaxID=299642 RepID=A0A8X6MXU0_NEPPI|nr:hypothetical protein NPIL_439681 [Nephila pilipes]
MFLALFFRQADKVCSHIHAISSWNESASSVEGSLAEGHLEICTSKLMNSMWKEEDNLYGPALPVPDRKDGEEAIVLPM